MDYKFIRNHIEKALIALNLDVNVPFNVEVTKSVNFGDFSSNVCMVISKKNDLNIEKLGQQMQELLAKHKKYYTKVEYVYPGFLNFFINPALFKKIVDYYNNPDFTFQKLPASERKNINVEYVSANPTGYLHIGHVRNALVGDVLSRVLTACGNNVTTEYWINDLGNQIALFENSVFARYLEICKREVNFPEDGYKGLEPLLVAKAFKRKYGTKFAKAEYNDEVGIVDDSVRKIVNKFSLGLMIKTIKEHLRLIGVKIAVWTSEKKIYKSKIFDLIAQDYLSDCIYLQDGATYLKTTLSGDEKDRVLIKSNGTPTYFLTDIANHYNKLQRGTYKMIDLWGSDHAGHIPKMKFALERFCNADEQFSVVQIQMLKLLKNGEEVKFSKRSGETLTIPMLLKMLNADSCRWFMLAQTTNTPILIDTKVTAETSSKNPIFYVQYAYARACQIIKKVEKTKKTIRECLDFDLLTDYREHAMMVQMLSFETLLHKINYSYEIHRLCTFLLNFAHLFHSWYDECHVLGSDSELTSQRYWLVKTVEKFLKNVLSLLGIGVHRVMSHLSKK